MKYIVSNCTILDKAPLSVMLEHESGSYVLCNLQDGLLFQQPLNLEFAAGEELSFRVNGNGNIIIWLLGINTLI